MSCFDDAPEFLDLDNRRTRTLSPVSKEQMEKKHAVLFPPEMVKGRTVLDLGCCLGATGLWCLSHGAAKYTGVEVQDFYADNAKLLLDKYYPGQAVIEKKTIEQWFKENTTMYDIVSILGVLYVFTDYYSILKNITSRAREAVMIEGLYPLGKLYDENFCGVQFITQQRINLAEEDASLIGRGTRLSPNGLKWIMREFEFASHEGLLFPEPMTSTRDVYQADPDSSEKDWSRYLLRFNRVANTRINLSTDLSRNKKGLRALWAFDK